MAEKHSNSNDEDCSSTKKMKVEDKNTTNENSDSIHSTTELNPSCFKMTRILQNNSTRKFICLEGTFEDFKSPAIVLLEQKSFPNDEVLLKKSFFNEDTNFKKLFTNDIYGNYNCFPSTGHNSTSSLLIILCIIHISYSTHNLLTNVLLLKVYKQL